VTLLGLTEDGTGNAHYSENRDAKLSLAFATSSIRQPRPSPLDGGIILYGTRLPRPPVVVISMTPGRGAGDGAEQRHG
jgi:hypothetical protein